MKHIRRIATLLILLSTPHAESLAFSFFSQGETPKSTPSVGGGTDSTQERQTADLFDSVYYKPKATPKKRKRAKPVAPVVDSDLLRFLAKQKLEQSSDDESPQSIPAQEAWLGQYNSHHVAQLLVDQYGVEPLAAEVAGDKVQSHVLERTARRRIRNFLKKRDLEWNNNASVEEQQLNEAATPAKYGLEDNLRLMKACGLTGNDMGAILTHTPGVALMMPKRVLSSASGGGVTLEDTIQRAYFNLLLGTLKLRKYDARKVLRTCPGLLTGRGSKRAQDVVTIMESLGVSVTAISREKTALPTLLTRSASSIFRLVSFLASDAVRMPVKSIGPLLRRKECLELLNTAAPVPGNALIISSNQDSDINNNSTGASEARRESINTVYTKMSKTAWALRNEIGTEDLGKVVAAYPSVLLLDADEQILPTADFLMSKLGDMEEDLPIVLQNYPFLLGRPMEETKRVIDYLVTLGVEEDSLPSIIRSFPNILLMDVEETMKPVVEFLVEIGISNIGRFITRLPPVLGYSVESELKPKWEYLSKVCLYPSFELSAFPAYFSYPFDRVIKSRYEYLQFIKQSPTQLLALDLVLRFGDKDFATSVAKDADGGVTYAKFVKRRKAAKAAAAGTTTQRQKPRRNAAKYRPRPKAP